MAEPFATRARAGLADATLRQAMAIFPARFQAKRSAAFDQVPDSDALRAAARAMKDHTLNHLGHYLRQFETAVRAGGGQVHWARDGAEACAIITGLARARGARRIAKSKSMTSEEIALNAALEAEGLEITETDLGEYIIQLRGEQPSHIIAPAVHLSRHQVAQTFHAHHTLDRAAPLDERADIVAEARAVLRERFLAADLGITGANTIIAETGQIVLVTNEGNADLTACLPQTHVVLAGIEKVVPTLDDAGLVLRLLARSATGQPLSTYTSFYGPGTARDFHVVLLDNGRSALLGGSRQPLLRCIRCGACMNHCPVYLAIGGHAYGATYPGPIGAALVPALAGLPAHHDLPDASTLCGRCEAVCPMQIDLPDQLRQWRFEARRQRLVGAPLRAGLALWAWLNRHPALYRLALRLARLGLRLQKRSVDGTRIGRLPGWFGNWTATRDLARPPATGFQDQWQGPRQ